MSLNNLKRHASVIGSITGIVGLIFSGVGMYRHIDDRLDLMTKDFSEFKSYRNVTDIQNRLSFIDIQIMIVQAELRAIDRIETPSEREKRQHRILEKQLIVLNEERTRLLGSP